MYDSMSLEEVERELISLSTEEPVKLVNVGSALRRWVELKCGKAKFNSDYLVVSTGPVDFVICPIRGEPVVVRVEVCSDTWDGDIRTALNEYLALELPFEESILRDLVRVLPGGKVAVSMFKSGEGHLVHRVLDVAGEVDVFQEGPALHLMDRIDGETFHEVHESRFFGGVA